MVRTARLDLENFFYHIICRGQRKNPIFFSKKDKQVFSGLVNSLLSETDMELYAYALMVNHVHLLIYRRTRSLADFMRRLNTRYAIYFNKKYGTTGHVFQDRYRSHIVLNVQYLKDVVKYIHLNPVKAKMSRDAKTFPYSSAAFYEGLKEQNIPRIKKLPCLSNNRAYKNVMEKSQDVIPYFMGAVGSESEFKHIDKRKRGRERSKYREKRAEDASIIRIIKETSRESGIDIEDISNSKWKRGSSDKRMKLVKKLSEKGLRNSDIARALNCDKSLISKILCRKK